MQKIDRNALEKATLAGGCCKSSKSTGTNTTTPTNTATKTITVVITKT
jgi:hypothetical protein